MFTVRKFGNSIIINTRNTNRINVFNIHQLRKQFILALQTPCDYIILNLELIGFMDSASFKVIDEMVQIAETHHVSFAFANLNTDLQEIFELVPNAANYTIEENFSSFTKPEKVYF